MKREATCCVDTDRIAPTAMLLPGMLRPAPMLPRCRPAMSMTMAPPLDFDLFHIAETPLDGGIDPGILTLMTATSLFATKSVRHYLENL